MQRFLRLSCFLFATGTFWGAVFSAPPLAAADADSAEVWKTPYLALGPMVGHTSSSESRIWAKSSRPARLGAVVGTMPDLRDGRHVSGPDLVADSANMGTVQIDGLAASTRYYYCLLLDGKRVMSPPYPSFDTAPPEGLPGHHRFAFISCLGNNGFNAAPSWADMSRTNFDLLLLLGDNHYANTTEPDKLRAAYFDHRSAPGVREVTSRIPTYAIWDDHDYGPNNSDGALPGKERSLQTFREHWANPSYGEPDNPGIYYSFRRGPIEFFMLDDRYYRTPNKDVNAPGRTMLGTGQLAWLKRQLLDSAAPVKILAAGSEWQSHSTEDCWSNFRKERDEIFSFIDEHLIRGVILLSGDRHFTAAYQVNGRFIEVTSGPFGSSFINSKTLPEMFYYHGGSRAWCVFDIDTTGFEPAVTLEVYETGNGLTHRREFKWDEILGTTKLPPLK